MKKAWFSAAEIAAEALPGMPASKRGVARMAGTQRWDRSEMARERTGRGGGLEYYFTLLHAQAQAVLARRYGDGETNDNTAPAPGQARAAPLGGVRGQLPRAATAADRTAQSKAAWAWYETQPALLRARAQARLDALLRIKAVARRVGRGAAIKTIAEECDASVQTIHNWLERVRGLPESDWLPALVPAPRGGGGREVAIDERFWDAFRADYLRASEPSLTSCYRRCERLAAAHGWAVPNLRTLRRRVEEIPASVLVMARKGRDATKALFPAQERDRSGFHALEAVNADGHKWDVFVRWPDGHVGRPVMAAFQDLYSGMFLAWRYARSENKDEIRLCFGDLIETYGVPDHCWFDNGRAFASKWLTGGIKNRFRFKVKAEEPDGLLKQLGVEVHWTTPYAGQSKPIERGFGDFARDISRHPAFQGAYCGNTPMAKPEDYGSRAVPFEDFCRIVSAEIEAHNDRAGRRTKVCAGIKSFRQAFEESYANAPIRKATAEQRRMCMLMADGVKVRRDGAIYLQENRYWHEQLLEHRGRLVTVRFDPEKLHDDLGVYTADGTLICVAALIEAAGFADTTAAREHAAARNAFLKATKEMLKAERVLSLPELVALQPKVDAAERGAPESKVVRPIFSGNLAMKPAAQAEEEQDAIYENLARGLRLVSDTRDV